MARDAEPENARLELVVAVDDAWGIGKDGGIPWRIPADMAHFRAVTTAGDETNAVIMGRRTWSSIPTRFRPLPARRNLVLTRRPEHFADPGAEALGGLEQALQALSGWRGRVFVIGGARVYDEALRDPRTTTVHLTRVAGDFGCDVRLSERPERLGFVAREREDWKVTTGGVRYRFEIWSRGSHAGA